MMARAWLAAICSCVCAAGCSKTIDDRGASTVDFSNAKRVVSAIFFAAQNDESHHLASLCDPKGEGNRHVERICRQEVGGEDWSEFKRQFENGKLIGEARISGDRALVNFVFGPEGTTPETMELVRRNARWHLLAF